MPSARTKQSFATRHGEFYFFATFRFSMQQYLKGLMSDRVQHGCTDLLRMITPMTTMNPVKALTDVGIG